MHSARNCSVWIGQGALQGVSGCWSEYEPRSRTDHRPHRPTGASVSCCCIFNSVRPVSIIICQRIDALKKSSSVTRCMLCT